MTKTIPVHFDKSHIITLGEKLYGESLELLRELIANAYDADATNVRIEVSTDWIIVRDDGSGMDENGLQEFFTIGSQNKKAAPISPRYQRHRIGQFGIGKFAVLTACKRFCIRTQKGNFSGEVIFDTEQWYGSDTWHLPLTEQTYDPLHGDGTTVVLEKLKKIFSLPDIERFIRERLPLDAPHFTIELNGKKLEPSYTPGKKFSFHVETFYGPIHGDLILPNFIAKNSGRAGIECLVRGIVICRSTFELDLPVLEKLRGRISADFLPITSDRSRFISDTSEYQCFLQTAQKEIRRIDREVRELHRERESKQADLTLRDSLSRMRHALRKNPDIAPQSFTPEKGQAQPEASNMITNTENEEGIQGLWESVLSATLGEPGKETVIIGAKEEEQQNEEHPKKVRVKDASGKTLTGRTMRFGGIGITCVLEGCGEEYPPAFTEGAVIYINTSHPLYKKQQKRGQDVLGFYLTFLLSQQVALMLAEGDTRKAFGMQNRLLTDSW